jgi:hypothetical protein
MTIDKKFEQQRLSQIDAIGRDDQLGALTTQWLSKAQ